ncbi:6961_t:CDS:2 [Entrophospora sp. SA101]|nr:6961_t:CDS:2 [Entrophospora sp. SA101]
MVATKVSALAVLILTKKDNQGLKTGKGYFQGKAILDFKISGGIMGIGSIHPNGKPYQVKGAGSFFLRNNFVFQSPQEVVELLKQDFSIEIKTMREHFSYTKIIDKMTDYRPLTEKTFFAPSREPPINDGANEKQALAVPNHTASCKSRYHGSVKDRKILLTENDYNLRCSFGVIASICLSWDNRQLTEKEVAEVLEAEE